MSWRQFVTRLAGLSSQSRFVHALASGGPTRAERVISEDADIDAFVAAYGAS